MKQGQLLGFACAVVIAAPQAFAQDWIPLQDGKSLAGWKVNEHPQTWVVEDGVFVTRGDRSHLFYVGKVAKHEFRNFELSAEVMTAPGSNSGIYVHTKWQDEGFPAAGYELQVINSNPPAERMNGYIEHKMTGSIYAVRNTWAAPANDNEWFNYRIRVVGKTIQTFINDTLIREYAEPANPFRPEDKKGRLLGSGTFALQGHDPGSVVKYRDIKVKILPNDAAPPAGVVPIEDRELDQLITQASNDNIPLIDVGVAVPEGDPVAFWSMAHRLGVTPIDSFPPGAAAVHPPVLVLFFDSDGAPDVAALKAAKAAGLKVVFKSNGKFEEAQLKRRLQAIKAAGLGWKDLYVPGKSGT